MPYLIIDDESLKGIMLAIQACIKRIAGWYRGD
jgi:hypothetical protein